MDHRRFDQLARDLAGARSRRSLLKGLGAALVGAAALPLATSAAPGRNNTCAQFCATVFGADTPAAGECTSLAAHGTGLCFQCGPLSDHTEKLCDQTCIPATGCCTDSECAAPETCGGGGVAHVCGIPCSGTVCTGTCCPSACECSTGREGTYCVAAISSGPNCRSNTDCPIPGTSCQNMDPNGNGVCEPIDCSTSSCPTGSVCLGSLCRERCAA